MTRKWISGLLAGAFVISGFNMSSAAASGPGPADTQEDRWEFISAQSYSDYLAQLGGSTHAVPAIEIDVTDHLKDSTGCSKADLKFEGKETLLTGEYSDAGWSFTVQQAGLYCVYIDYYTVAGNGNKIERSVMLDGKVPYKEAGSVMLSRIWKDKDEKPVYLGENQIRSEQVQQESWTGSYLYDSSGFYNDPLDFYLTAGVHTLRLNAVREPAVLGKITLRARPVYPSYADKLREYEEQGCRAADKGYKVQAEKMYLKSDPTIYPVCDFGSASMEPYTSNFIKLNKISGEKFQLTGQWVEWKLDVPQTGLYEIALKYKQHYYDGGFSSRGVKIDGDYPFEEARNIRFAYTDKWMIKPVGGPGGERYRFYLTQGEHTLQLCVTLGDMAEVIGRVQDIVYELNTVYRRIVTITGVTPDLYRDYEFEALIPEAIEELESCSGQLKQIKNSISKISGTSGSYVSIFEKLIVDLDIMWEKPRKIAGKLKNMKDNLSGLASWMAQAQNQPLDLDWIKLEPAGGAEEKKAENVWDNLMHSLKVFAASFYMDYSAVGSRQQDADLPEIKVWIGNNSLITTIAGAGRDQSQIIKQMSDNLFMPQHDIRVNLQLVAPGTLLTSIIAGTAPDVSLQCTNTEPMNYAIRDAVCGLTGFDDFDAVKTRFSGYALTPYTFQGETYALPETLTYPMMFYRKDVFRELNVTPPTTWNEACRLIIALQRNNLQFGIPVNWNGYLMFLFQKGGKLYTDEADKSCFGDDVSLQAFRQWTDFFNSYGQPVQYDFPNRFRSGEMPVAIMDFTMYNQLSVFAPEIKNLWGLAPVPGTADKNGKINHAVTSSGTSCVIMSASKRQKESWEFLKWWTDAPAQTAYGRELESVMGIAARYPTANLEAFSSISWPKENADSLKKQGENVYGVPEVPGSYITSRYVDFAFQAVINQKEDVGDTVLEYAKQINEELSRKRKEFKLS